MPNDPHDDVVDLRGVMSTPVPNAVLETAVRLPSTPAKVLLVVVRMTLGWQSKGGTGRRASATISYGEILRATGLRSPVAVSRAVRLLVEEGIVETVDEEGVPLSTGSERRSRRRPLRFRLARRLIGRCG